MIDFETFLTALYVFVEDFCKGRWAPERSRGAPAGLTRGEVVTLAIAGQWECFGSERGFYRYAQRHLRGAFPGLPDRSQFNRLIRLAQADIAASFSRLAEVLREPADLFEALDGTAAPTRDAKRRGLGWLPGLADIGWSNRLGWFEGFHLLLAVGPTGVVTGFGFAPASVKDQPLADTFFAARHRADARLPTVGLPTGAPYVTDKGFEGEDWHAHWHEDYGAEVITPPKRNSRKPWSRAWRRWLAGIRQVVETVNGSLHHVFRLDRERPHELGGFAARVTAKMALHNFCIWLNRKLGRPSLAFVELISW
ncbi:MAG TPA: transposase [Gemmata sp.]|nr:transposase [Gemmata sp.]